MMTLNATSLFILSYLFFTILSGCSPLTERFDSPADRLCRDVGKCP